MSLQGRVHPHNRNSLFMSPIDTNDAQSVTPNTPPVSNTADNAAPAPTPQPSPVAPQPIPANTASGVSAQPQTSPAQSSSQQPPPSQTQMVSNPVQHPAVQRASLLRDVAQALAGGPRVQTTIDPNTGQTTRTQIPLSGRDIGLAIALEAISGSLTGLAQRGPNAAAQAGAAGFAQGQQRILQARAAQEAQAQQQFENQGKALAQKASTFETNSRTLLNVATASHLGEEAIKDLVAINRASGVLDVDPDTLENGGQPMTEGDLMAAMQSGTINATSHLGPVAGFTVVNGPNGQQQIETTHLVIKDGNVKVPLTQQMWDTYANGDVPGFTKGARIGDGQLIPLRMLQNANEQLGERTLTNHKLDDLRTVLDGTPWAGKVPAKVDFSHPGVARAMTAFSRYQSHDAANAADPFLALQQMSAAKRNPDGSMQPNPDARFADTVATQLGGWPLLEAAHDQLAANRKAAADFAVIDSEAKANAVLAAPKRFTSDQQSAAKAFLALSEQQGAKKAAQDARSRAIADGADVQAMFRFGRNPVTGETLNLDNAAPSMLVDPNANVIPQDLVSMYKPTAQERQTADTARQVLQISAGLRQAIQQNPNLAGPLSGRSKQGLAKLGLGDAQAQKYLDDLAFLSSASTKMHTGRFSNEILKKMDSLIKPGMNPDQFGGALDSITGVAQRYADEDRLTTVADWKAQQNAGTPAVATQSQTPKTSPQPRVVPPGATPGRDASGNIVGYRTADGKVVRF